MRTHVRRHRELCLCCEPVGMGCLSSTVTVLFLCACGTGLTLYAGHVQRSRLEDKSYRAFCDLDDIITCSQILAEDRDTKDMLQWVSDRVGVAFLSNLHPHFSVFRVSFFPLLCLLGCIPLTISYFLATLLSSAASMTSAYLLYMQFQVHDKICLPCLAIYFLHVVLFFVLTLRWTYSGSGEIPRSQPPQSSKDSQRLSKQANDNVKGDTDKERSSSDEGSRREQKMEAVGGKTGGKAQKRKKNKDKDSN